MAASLAWHQRPPVLFLFSFFTILFSTILAFEVPILDTGKLHNHDLSYTVLTRSTDYSRQICTGMWGGPSAYINGMREFWCYERGLSYLLVSFDSISQGQLAMVIYEWEDAKYLGKAQVSDMGNELPVIFVFVFHPSSLNVSFRKYMSALELRSLRAIAHASSLDISSSIFQKGKI
jgi:hypothetical protein